MLKIFVRMSKVKSLTLKMDPDLWHYHASNRTIICAVGVTIDLAVDADFKVDVSPLLDYIKSDQCPLKIKKALDDDTFIDTDDYESPPFVLCSSVGVRAMH